MHITAMIFTMIHIWSSGLRRFGLRLGRFGLRLGLRKNFGALVFICVY
jgi:hypothetical protein